MKKNYFSYLLRVWLAQDEHKAIWRASLEDPHSGEQMAFTSLARLCAFLEDQCTMNATGDKPQSSKS